MSILNQLVLIFYFIFILLAGSCHRKNKYSGKNLCKRVSHVVSSKKSHCQVWWKKTTVMPEPSPDCLKTSFLADRLIAAGQLSSFVVQGLPKSQVPEVKVTWNKGKSWSCCLAHHLGKPNRKTQGLKEWTAKIGRVDRSAGPAGLRFFFLKKHLETGGKRLKIPDAHGLIRNDSSSWIRNMRVEVELSSVSEAEEVQSDPTVHVSPTLMWAL